MLSGNRNNKMMCVSIIIALFLFLILISFFSENTKASTEPSAEIIFSQGNQTANVTSVEEANITFYGTVSFYHPVESACSKYLIGLDAEAEGWDCEIKPTTMTFDRQISNQSFEVNITVPSGTPASEIGRSYHLIVSGRIYPIPGTKNYSINEETTMIKVGQYYDFNISCYEPIKKIYYGERAKFLLEITNNGNGINILHWELSNADKLDNNGVEFQWGDNSIYLDENEISNLSLSFFPSTKIKNDKISIEIRFSSWSSEIDGNIVEKNITLQILLTDDNVCLNYLFIGIPIFLILIIIIASIFIRKRYYLEKHKKKKLHQK